MPHVVVKLYPGRSDLQKQTLADELTKVVMSTLSCSEAAVSVGIEEVGREDWAEAVYKHDILGKSETIFKKPGADPRK